MDLGNLDYIEIFRSSFTLMILLVCSILAVAFMIERWLFYRRAKVDSTRFLSRIKMSLENNNFQEAVSTCERDRSPVAAVLRVGLLNRALPYHQLDELMHTTREEERVKLERYLGVLGTLGNSAPFIGLFGTVVGIIKAFHDLAASGSGGPTVVAAGIAPLVEIAFDYTTDIKLLELANLDRPILRRLMIEAPGTYNHSVIVGSMVEAAASSIGANPLLAKVCGYYHDIGKIKKPLYFIENQKNGKNRHDKLAPSMSSLILMSHIKEGVEIAKENKLGQAIIDTIRQHHGTSLISYFYEKAKKMKGADAVNIDNFLYPGPKPQTREAALVMLADVVEAASRVLDNPTPSRIQGLVQDLINKIFSDGQLENCELTLKDLHSIAKSFNKILTGIYHHRIEYPEKPAANNRKGGNGNSDRQQAKQVQDITRENTANSTGHIKRLGLS